MSQLVSSDNQRMTHSSWAGVAIFWVGAFSIVALSLAFFAMALLRPHLGADLSFENQSWTIQSLDVDGAAYSAGIREGDRPVAINGEPSGTFLARYERDGLVLGALVSRLSVVDKYGNFKSVTLANSSPSFQSVVEVAVWIIVSAVFWVVGFYVFLKRRGNVAARVLCISGLVFGLVLSANLAGQRVIPFAIHLAVASSIFGPWVLLHFFLVLPEEGTRLRRSRMTYLIYLAPAITLLLYFLVGYAEGQPTPGFRSFRFLEITIVFAATLSVAILNLLRATSPRTKQQMKIVAVACFAALIPPLSFTFLPNSIWGQPIIPGEASVLFIAFVPLGLGYAVLTQKLMDIDVIVRRGIVYGLVTVIMALILSAAIFLSIVFRKSLDAPQQIGIALLLGCIAATLFGPTRERIEILVDKLFYRDRYDYRQIIQSMSTALKSVSDTTDISRLVVGTTVSTLNLAGGILFVKAQRGSFDVAAMQGTFSNAAKQTQLLALISDRNQAIEFPNMATNAMADLAFLIPLTAGRNELGFLCLSHKTSRQAFSSDDLFLLQGLASLAAMALHSATLVRDVSVRDTFVSIASHELRTPLTAILGYADLLLRRNPPEATRRQWLTHILDNSRRVTAMVDDLLNVSRIQSGRVDIKLDKVKLSDVLKETLNLARENSQKHEFVADLTTNLPYVRIDRDKFSQVIGNLLSNAVKYSPNGGRITLSALNDEERHQVVVSVSDQGIGISQEDQCRLFATFHRIQRPETQGIRGSGLGLYIAKEWTEAMGGRIWLESELNRGSTFFVGVPVTDDSGDN